MMREADTDGDGQIDFEGAHPVPRLLRSLNISSAIFAMQSSSRCIQSTLFCSYCSLTVIGIDDGRKVIAPGHLLERS